MFKNITQRRKDKTDTMSDFHTNFGTTLRDLAATEQDPERKRQMALLAAQLEVAFDQQGSKVQVALWDVQDATRAKIDDIHEHLGNANTLSSAVLEAVNGLRTDVQNSAAETAARLGKQQEEIVTLQEGQAALTTRVSDLGEEMSGVKGEVAELRGDFTKLRGDVNTLQGTVARIEVATERTRAGIASLLQWTKDQPIPEEIKRHLDDAAKQ